MDPINNVYIQRIAWAQESEVQELMKADIGIAPMADDEWSKGKSGLKVVQYMASGLPVVASAVGPHFDLMDSGIHGYLVRNESEWINSLRILRDNPDLRRNMGAAGKLRAQQEYCFSAIAAGHAELFKRLCRKYI
jgi:glycosyltransferase involved in cell wall biosynthesis